MSLSIEDYALIGDCETGALVGRDGSIDWLCFPRFDSPACFAALLGTSDHGRWLLAPQPSVAANDSAGERRATRRRYLPSTMILETTFETETGVVTVTDFMPGRDRSPNVVRIVTGQRGCVSMQTELVMRFDYGSITPWVQKAPDGLSAIGGPDSLRFYSPVPLTSRDFVTRASFDVREGESMAFVLAWHPSHEAGPPSVDAAEALRVTRDWWEAWSARCEYQGPYREAVLRSLLTLKALTYAPTGGIVAAATTSLPEKIGGVRNWDYRFCWLRDATFALFALLKAGYRDEARDWEAWLLRAVAGRPERTSIMYGLGGERRLPEMILDWLPGYEGSKPVRIGNAAAHQFQLDVYGEVLDCLYQARKSDLNGHHEEDWRLARALVDFVVTAVDDPDEGIWEVRGPRRHFTHSKVMAWVALDRGVRSIEEFGVEGDVARWRDVRDRLHAQICQQGWNEAVGAFVQSYGSDQLDASLLLIPIVGFLPIEDPRVGRTIAAIEAHLFRDGFVNRYDTAVVEDGLPAGEGAFLICTFWLADCYTLLGRDDDARALFERLLTLRNDVGLLSEEYDLGAQRLVGNFPQAFSHVGLITTAMNLESRGVAHERSKRATSAVPARRA